MLQHSASAETERALAAAEAASEAASTSEARAGRDAKPPPLVDVYVSHCSLDRHFVGEDIGAVLSSVVLQSQSLESSLEVEFEAAREVAEDARRAANEAWAAKKAQAEATAAMAAAAAATAAGACNKKSKRMSFLGRVSLKRVKQVGKQQDHATGAAEMSELADEKEALAQQAQTRLQNQIEATSLAAAEAEAHGDGGARDDGYVEAKLQTLAQYEQQALAQCEASAGRGAASPLRFWIDRACFDVEPVSEEQAEALAGGAADAVASSAGLGIDGSRHTLVGGLPNAAINQAMRSARERGARVRLHARERRFETLVSALPQTVAESKEVVILLSPGYLDSLWNVFELVCIFCFAKNAGVPANLSVQLVEMQGEKANALVARRASSEAVAPGGLELAAPARTNPATAASAADTKAGAVKRLVDSIRDFSLDKCECNDAMQRRVLRTALSRLFGSQHGAEAHLRSAVLPLLCERWVLPSAPARLHCEFRELRQVNALAVAEAKCIAEVLERARTKARRQRADLAIEAMTEEIAAEEAELAAANAQVPTADQALQGAEQLLAEQQDAAKLDTASSFASFPNSPNAFARTMASKVRASVVGPVVVLSEWWEQPREMCSVVSLRAACWPGLRIVFARAYSTPLTTAVRCSLFAVRLFVRWPFAPLLTCRLIELGLVRGAEHG